MELLPANIDLHKSYEHQQAPQKHIKAKVLKVNNSFSNSVVLLQSLLNERNFSCGSADGYFGNKTKKPKHQKINKEKDICK